MLKTNIFFIGKAVLILSGFALLAVNGNANAAMADVDIFSFPDGPASSMEVDSDSGPIMASVTDLIDGNYFASANVSTGTLAARVNGGPGATSNIFSDSGRQAVSTIEISFTNVTTSPIALPSGWLSLFVTSENSSTPAPDSFARHNIQPKLQASTSTAATNVQVNSNNAVLYFDNNGNFVPGMSGINFMPVARFGADIDVTTNDFEEFVAELLLGPLTVNPGDTLDILAELFITAAGTNNTLSTTDASNTAELLFQLPADVSINDFDIDTTANLDWVVPIPIPPAIWLFISAFGFLGFISQRKYH